MDNSSTVAAPAERIIGTAHDYAGLVTVLKQRVAELGQPMETLDVVGGLPLRYTSKLLAPRAVKNLGPVSMGPLLAALGLKMIIVEDAEMLARVSKFSAWRTDAHAAIRTRKRRKKSHYLKGNSEWGRLMTVRRLAVLSPRKRRRLAKHANAVRWSEVKKAALPAPSP